MIACPFRAGVIALALALPLGARTQANITLRTPDATFPHDFSQLRGARELPDGRLLITDRLEERLVLANLATGKVQVIGRPGRGPLEYHLPTRLIPLPGDSTLLIDEGNSRVAVVSPALRIVRSFALRIPGITIPLQPRAIDARGRHYLQIPGWISNSRDRGDSVWIVRFDPRGERLDTVALIKGATSPPVRDGRQLGIPFVPFAAQDGWAVTRDGHVAIVRAAPYRVEWHRGDGVVVRGPIVAREALAVTMADRVAFTRDFIANSPIGGRDPNGGMSAAPAELLEKNRIRQVAESNTFASVMGPFTQAAPVVAADGMLWVERSAHAGTPSTWDVFDSAGRIVRLVSLPAGRRLVALGRSGAYLAVADEDGLERLERYRIP